MSAAFGATELEGVAVFWRIHITDGTALGFTGHDRDLTFGGLTHRAAPGMLPSAIRRTAGLDEDSAEMRGALSHDALPETWLAAGRFDDARVAVGAVDWETLAHRVLYRGRIGEVAREGAGFTADLRSAKEALAIDRVPRTGPTCRAVFCGPGCGLSAPRFERRARLVEVDAETSTLRFDLGDHRPYLFGQLRFWDGPLAGRRLNVLSADADRLTVDADLDALVGAGHQLVATLREGCDHTHATCHDRFDNAANFQGEPFLPGNDLVARYAAGPG